MIFIKSDIVVGLAFQNNQNKDNIEMQMMYHWDTKITQFMRLNTDNIAEHIFFSNCKINLSFTGHGLQNSVCKPCTLSKVLDLAPPKVTFARKHSPMHLKEHLVHPQNLSSRNMLSPELSCCRNHHGLHEERV